MEAFFASDGQPDLNLMDPPVRLEQHGSGPKSLKTLANQAVQKELQNLPNFERAVERGYAGRDRQQRANMIYGGPPGVWPGEVRDVGRAVLAAGRQCKRWPTAQTPLQGIIGKVQKE